MSDSPSAVIEVRIHVEGLDASKLSRRDLPTILRGQLTILRVRAEQGIPISVESIARAERLTRNLEAALLDE
jgi:hypothetical protein